MSIGVEKVHTKRIYRAIIEQIVDLIRTDALRVGQKLPPERELAELFGVSRPSVREALRVMEVMGLLERRPGGGSVVTDLNVGDLLTLLAPILLKRDGAAIELVELRYLLEGRAAEVAARAAAPAAAARLAACMERMASACEARDPEAEARADIDFHETVFSLAGNHALEQAARFITTLLESSVRFGRKVILEGGYGSRELLAQHRRIVDAVVAGRPMKARTAMEAHMQLVLEYYTRAVAAGRSAAAQPPDAPAAPRGSAKRRPPAARGGP